MPEPERTVDEQIADAEVAAAEARKWGRPHEEQAALERAATLQALRDGTKIGHADNQGHEDNKPSA